MRAVSTRTRFFLLRLCVIFTAFISFMVISINAQAQLSIDITKGNAEPIAIAVPDFIHTDHRLNDVGKEIAQIVRADLERSGLFKALNPASFIETQTDIDFAPNYSDWRVIKADALLSGRVIRESDTKMRVEFRLWDVFGEQQLTCLLYTSPSPRDQRGYRMPSSA